MDFDAKIQEDAWLNYAKISYEIGNPYQSVPQVLTSYLKAYPNSGYKEEVETLLIDSYITSKNYKEALELLKGKNSFENKAAYQKVAFFRAVELFNENKYNEALGLFKGSLKEPIDPVFVAKATFWKAETEYNLTNYNDALIGFKQFDGYSESAGLSENENLNYNLAYTYFKLKDYANASNYFEKFIKNKSNDKLRQNDAYLRLADGYFVSSKYQNAIEAYKKAIQINEIETDYAAFQTAMSQGYLGKGADKISELKAFINQYPK